MRKKTNLDVNRILALEKSRREENEENLKNTSSLGGFNRTNLSDEIIDIYEESMGVKLHKYSDSDANQSDAPKEEKSDKNIEEIKEEKGKETKVLTKEEESSNVSMGKDDLSNPVDDDELKDDKSNKNEEDSIIEKPKRKGKSSSTIKDDKQKNVCNNLNNNFYKRLYISDEMYLRLHFIQKFYYPNHSMANLIDEVFGDVINDLYESIIEKKHKELKKKL